MPTKHLALLVGLSLLAACSPQAADSAAGAATQNAPAAAAPPPAAGHSAAALPSGDPELDQARASAGCAVPADVYDVEDVRIYCRMPADVQAFLARENTCQHFAGEEPYDDERRRELEDANARYCEGRRTLFDGLVARHRDDCSIRQALIAINGRYDLAFDLDLMPCEG